MVVASDPTVTVDSGSTSDISFPDSPIPESFDSHTQTPPTLSHAVAKGITSQPGEEVVAAGVNTSDGDQDVAFQPHILDMSKEDVWIILRRFNLLVFRVVATTNSPLSGLDMGPAEQGRTSPEQVQAQLARLYMTVIIQLFAFYKHMTRLRSWREPQRTSIFLSVYVVAWLANLLAPIMLAFLMLIILSPDARLACFPSVPPSIVDATTGGLQKPPAGVLASETTVTGAAENHRGEAVEHEAHAFITSFAKLIMRITSDKDSKESSPEDDPSPDIAKLSGKVASAKSKTDKDGDAPRNDKTEEPMRHAIEDFDPQPLLDLLFAFIDNWERFGNVLNPIPLFPGNKSRMLLAVCLVPPTLGTLCLSRDTMMKSFQLLLGLVMFGKPVIRRGGDLLNHYYPSWRSYCELRNSILKGAPTNAQLAITMLRVGEQISSPLPPPAVVHDSPKMEATADSDTLLQLGATDEEIHQAIKPDSHDSGEKSSDEPRSKRLERFMGFVKSNSKRGVSLFHRADKVRAHHGNTHAQARLDLGQTTRRVPDAGPFKFPARFNKAPGYIHIATAAMTPSVSWRSHDENLETAWVVMVDDIEDLSKVDGMSVKTKHFVQWALDQESVDGLKLKTSSGECYHLDQVVKRDEVFNRLIAMGNQIWEVC